MYEKFTLYGEDPICWVQRNIDKEEAVKIGTADCISKDIRARWYVLFMHYHLNVKLNVRTYTGGKD